MLLWKNAAAGGKSKARKIMWPQGLRKKSIGNLKVDALGWGDDSIGEALVAQPRCRARIPHNPYKPDLVERCLQSPCSCTAMGGGEGRNLRDSWAKCPGAHKMEGEDWHPRLFSELHIHTCSIPTNVCR